jgi:hypothetical protein
MMHDNDNNEYTSTNIVELSAGDFRSAADADAADQGGACALGGSRWGLGTRTWGVWGRSSPRKILAS